MSQTTAALPSDSSQQGPTNPSITIASWNDLVLLVRELDRHKKPGFYVRLVLGDMPQRRYGPFHSLQAAKRSYGEMIGRLDPALCDLSNELAGIASKHGTSGLYNIED